MNDTILIIGGVIAIIVLTGGAGWLWRTATRRGKSQASAASTGSYINRDG
jgi:FtsZ-interacting cell division protein ZipA